MTTIGAKIKFANQKKFPFLIDVKINTLSLNENYTLFQFDTNNTHNQLNNFDRDQSPFIIDLQKPIKPSSIPLNLMNDDFSFKCSVSGDDPQNLKYFLQLCKFFHKNKISYIMKITSGSHLNILDQKGQIVQTKKKFIINLLSKQSFLLIFTPCDESHYDLECSSKDCSASQLSESSSAYVYNWLKKCNSTEPIKGCPEDDLNTSSFYSMEQSPDTLNSNKSQTNIDNLDKKSCLKLSRSFSIFNKSIQSGSLSTDVLKKDDNSSNSNSLIKNTDCKQINSNEKYHNSEESDQCLKLCLELSLNKSTNILNSGANISEFTSLFKSYLNSLKNVQKPYGHIMSLKKKIESQSDKMSSEVQIIFQLIIYVFSNKILSQISTINPSVTDILDLLVEYSLLKSSQDLKKLLNDVFLELFQDICPDTINQIFQYFYGESPINSIHIQFDSPQKSSAIIDSYPLSPSSKRLSHLLFSPCDSLKADISKKDHNRSDSTSINNSKNLHIKSMPLTIHSPIADLKQFNNNNRSKVKRSKSFVVVSETPKKLSKIVSSVESTSSYHKSMMGLKSKKEKIIPKSPPPSCQIKDISQQHHTIFDNDDDEVGNSCQKSSTLSPMSSSLQNSSSNLLLSPRHDVTLSKSCMFYSSVSEKSNKDMLSDNFKCCDTNEEDKQIIESNKNSNCFKETFSFIYQKSSTVSRKIDDSIDCSNDKFIEENKENIPPSSQNCIKENNPDECYQNIPAKRRLFNLIDLQKQSSDLSD